MVIRYVKHQRRHRSIRINLNLSDTGRSKKLYKHDSRTRCHSRAHAHRSTIRVANGANYTIWLTRRYVVAMIVANPTLAQSLASPLLSSSVSRYSSPFPVTPEGVVASGTDATSSSQPPTRCNGHNNHRSCMSNRQHPRRPSRPCNHPSSHFNNNRKSQFYP